MAAARGGMETLSGRMARQTVLYFRRMTVRS